MDRQHPRDLFDVLQLFANGGITACIRRAFVIYLASHNRPVHEVLFPRLRDVRQEFEHSFAGMTAEPVELEALLEARERMARALQHELTADERLFLHRWSRPHPTGSCLAYRILNAFLVRAGSCKTLRVCARAIRGNSPGNPMSSHDYWDKFLPKHRSSPGS